MSTRSFGSRAFLTIVLGVSCWASDPVWCGSLPDNGQFTVPGLAGWTVQSGSVSDGGAYALFQEHPVDLMSSLVQEFTLPAEARMLSFDLSMTSEQGSVDSSMPPDAFLATLYDSSTDLNPLLSIPGYSEFFYMDNTGVVDDSVAVCNGTNVSIDVSSIAGRSVFLALDLVGGDDGMLTTVGIDNVSVSVVPVPGAVLLGLLGVGSSMMGLRRRRSV